MEYVRTGKGNAGSNKESGESSNPGKTSSFPLAIRFTAGEESVEEIHSNYVPVSITDSSTTTVNSINTGRSSLSSSPQLNSDDFSWKKDFLQSSFFHRKRSGSVEGNTGTSPGSCLISNLSSSAGDPNAVGAWKLIKGKVSQAMEDIKSKNNQTAATPNLLNPKQQKGENDGDTDPETPTSDISIEVSTSLALQGSNPTKQKDTLLVQSQTTNDSDFDADAEILDLDSSTQIPLPTPVLRRSFVSLRSKTLPISSVKSNLTKKPSSTAASGKEENRLFRRRKKDKSADSVQFSTESSTKKKDVEIESGVEMLEDMVLPQYSVALTKEDEKQSDQQNLLHSTDESSARPPTDPHGEGNKGSSASGSSASNQTKQDFTPSSIESNYPSNQLADKQKVALSQLFKDCLSNTCRSQAAIITVALFVALLTLPINDFFRGILACLFTISLCSTFVEIFKTVAERSDFIQKIAGIESGRSERFPFQIPDYKNMPICEIPAVEEHKPLKLYAGWMNEINSYDPSNFHVSMTRPIYIRLDGSIIRIFNTSARIPKRASWNEPPIHRKNVTFTRHRCFNLMGCRVEMCPRGLARKRYFSRKYPIQLIIKTKDAIKIEDTKSVTSEEGQSSSTAALQLDLNGGTNSSIAQDSLSICHQNSNESNEDNSEQQGYDFDFGTAVLHSNLQKLHDGQQPENLLENVPCGDETRLLLFARCDREKEDWYRRFVAASLGEVNDQEIRNPNIITRTDEEINATIKLVPTTDGAEESNEVDGNTNEAIKSKVKSEEENGEFEGLIIASNAARNAYDYVKFMSLYQNRRQKKQDELWKGVDQSLLLGPSAGMVWANVLIGRVLYGCLKDQELLEKVQDFLQKKLSAIKLPSFMEDVVIAQTNLGDTPPIIHRVSQPVLDERGIWIDADITYEGLMHMTITTKLNLLRLKRQQQQQNQTQESAGVSVNSSNDKETFNSNISTESPIQTETTLGVNVPNDERSKTTAVTPTGSYVPGNTGKTANSAIYDSDAETSGASSSDSDCAIVGSIDPATEQSQPAASSQAFYNAPGNSRRLLRIVDRITASNLFQSATEISYIQRAMENMNTTITLKVELKGLIARIVLNLPPPPSDRLWIAFRGPPRLWISAKPAVGDHTFDWSIVTNVIENKLCDEVYKYLVYPNMVDIIAPFLGQSTYKE